MYLSLVYILCSLCGITTSTECNVAYECSGDQKGFIIINDTKARIDCNAYSSCLGARALVADGNINTQRIICGGSYSCYQANVISAGGLNTVEHNFGEVLCHGYHSCSHANLYSQNAIHCQGGFACLNSQLTYDVKNWGKYNSLTLNYTHSFRNISSLSIHCNGIYGCAGTSIKTAREIYGWGAYSLYYSNIYSNGSDLNITLIGHKSGYGLNIFCDKSGFDDVCQLYCHGDACNNTYLHCITEDNNNGGDPGRGHVRGYDMNCVYYCDDGVLCPFVCIDQVCVRGGLAGEQWLIEWNEEEWENRFEHIQNITDIYTYDEYFCDINETYFAASAVLCDNFQDYGDCYLTNKSIINQNGSICCRGGYSCAYGKDFGNYLDTSARINGDNTNNNNHNNNNNSNNKRGNHKESHIICDATRACESQTLINSNGNIFCGGFDSCVYSTLYGNNYDSNSDYYNDETYVHCDGDGSCYYTDIYYFDHLYCNSLDSCDSTIIVGVKNIYANGYWSLGQSIIESNGMDMNMNMTVHIQSDYAAYGTWIYCLSNDTCNIICATYKACYNTTLICNGTCNVFCNGNGGEGDADEDNFVCPTMIGGTQSTDITSSSGYLTTNLLHLTTQSSNTIKHFTHIPTFPQHPEHPGDPATTITATTTTTSKTHGLFDDLSNFLFTF